MVHHVHLMQQLYDTLDIPFICFPDHSLGRYDRHIGLFPGLDATVEFQYAIT